MRPRYVYTQGQQIGQWTVLDCYQRNSKTRVLCRCQCGTERELSARNIAVGRSRSCGCHRNRKHGQSYTVEFRRWNTQLARGQLCDAWESFEMYLAYVSSLPGYGVPGARLTRIKLRFPFRPGNVEWRVKGQPAASVAS